MFDQNSRYKGIEIATTTVPGPEGEPREVRYVLRRFIPNASTFTAVGEHKTIQGDRMDLVTMRYMGDPTVWWKLCDANNVMDPEELLEEPGRFIVIPGVSGWR